MIKSFYNMYLNRQYGKGGESRSSLLDKFMSLGTRIKKCRKSHNFTQKELSNKLGLTQKMISFYENDQRIPPIDILIKLSQIFSVSTDYLLLGEESGTTNIGLTPNELKFLQLYTKLDELDQHECIGFIKGMLAQKSTK